MGSSEIVIKEEPLDVNDDDDIAKLSYEEKIKLCTPISQPLASQKLCKKIIKLIKKANSLGKSSGMKFGLKNVQKAIKTEKGMVFFAGDVFPMDIIMHLPIVCEERNIPYCYVPTRSDLGIAMGTARIGPIMVFITPNESYKELYDTVWEKLKLLPYKG